MGIRCPECGGTLKHLVTDIDGSNYYQCNNGLTTLKKENGKIVTSIIIPCDTIVDSRGKKYSGSTPYVSDNKLHILPVQDGKERR